MSLPSLAARVAPSLAVAALAVLLGAAEQDVTVTDPQQAVPGHIVATGSVTYSTTANGRGCTLQYWPSEASALLGTALSPATMDQLGACLGPLFGALLRDHPAMPELTLTLGDLTALTNRIDAALDTSPKWNRANGSPRTGSLPSVVTGMINGQDLAKELNEVVRPRGYDLRATSVRMVSTGPVALFNGHRLLTGISMLEFQAANHRRQMMSHGVPSFDVLVKNYPNLKNSENVKRLIGGEVARTVGVPNLKIPARCV